MCAFCKRHRHTLHKCQKIMEKKTVEERVKFIQSEKLCFGCLKTGHTSKHCTSRSVSEKCEKCHPTCLHQDRERKDQKFRLNQMQSKVSQGSAESKSEQINDQPETQQVTSNKLIQRKRNDLVNPSCVCVSSS